MDAKVREQLKAQYPGEKLYTLSSPDDGIEIVVRGAEHGAWLKYRTMAGDMTDPVKRASAAQFLVQACIVYPEREEFHQQLVAAKKAGFYNAVVRELSSISGDREVVQVGEL